MALILNVETASEICSVALSDEKGLIYILENTEGKSHASLVSVFINDILQKHHLTAENLNAVAVSMGPGSYTGLRIGVSVAKGICFGAGLPLIAVPTLQSLTIAAAGNSEFKNETEAWFCPMLDARRLEVYMAFLDKQFHFTTDIKAEIIHEDSFADVLAKRIVYFFGNGSAKCRDIIKHPNAKFIERINLSARDMITLSQKAFLNKKFEDVAYFEPFYLKDFVATVAKNKVIRPDGTTFAKSFV